LDAGKTMNKTIKWIGLSGILAALAAGGVAIYAPHAREARWHKEAVAALPVRPANVVYPEFVHRVDTAEKQMRAGGEWRVGLSTLASLYHANGDTQEAATLYGILIRADAGNARWANRLASIYALYGQLDQAVLLWQRTAKIDPHYLPAQLNLADAMIKMNRAPESVPIYDAVLKVDPQNPYAVAGLAKADIAAGRWLQAQSRLENAGLLTEVKIGGNILVAVYEHLGATDKADAIRSRAKSTDSYLDIPDPWLDEVSDDCYDAFRLTVDSGVARRKADLPRALRLLGKAIQVKPTYALAYFQMGLLQVDLHNLEAAKKALRTSADLDPTYGDAWAKLVALSGSREEAELALAEGLRKCPDSPTLHSLNGKRLKAAGQLDEALEEFQLVAKLRPAEILGLIDCTQIYFQREQNELALQTLQRALEIVPEDPLVLSTLAIYWSGVKNEPKAHELALRCRVQVRLPKNRLLDVTNAHQNAFGRSPW
jgi:tetratricopeptide (TPR) repeat protein